MPIWVHKSFSEQQKADIYRVLNLKTNTSPQLGLQIHSIQMETPKPSNMNLTFLEEEKKNAKREYVVSPIKEEKPAECMLPN